KWPTAAEIRTGIPSRTVIRWNKASIFIIFDEGTDCGCPLVVGSQGVVRIDRIRTPPANTEWVFGHLSYIVIAVPPTWGMKIHDHLNVVTRVIYSDASSRSCRSDIPDFNRYPDHISRGERIVRIGALRCK